MRGIFVAPNFVWVYGWDPNYNLDLTFSTPPNDPYCSLADEPHLTDGSMIDLTDTCASYSVEVGDKVTVTDGTNWRDHIVTSVEVTDVDYDEDTVSGRAEPDSHVYIQNHQGYLPTIEVDADSYGNWVANYRDIDFDLTYCHGGEAWQMDDDGDTTQFSWFPAFWCEIRDILLLFDDWVDAGDLQGSTTGMRSRLELADKFNETGNTRQACLFLNLAYKKCDGQPQPADNVAGSAQEELASIILMVRDIGIQCP